MSIQINHVRPRRTRETQKPSTKSRARNPSLPQSILWSTFSKLSMDDMRTSFSPSPIDSHRLFVLLPLPPLLLSAGPALRPRHALPPQSKDPGEHLRLYRCEDHRLSYSILSKLIRKRTLRSFEGHRRDGFVGSCCRFYGNTWSLHLDPFSMSFHSGI